MRNEFNTNEQVSLYIGSYSVHMTYDNCYNTYVLPSCLEMFQKYIASSIQLYSINYLIKIEKEFNLPNHKPIAGFNSGPIPYQIYMINNGDYLWVRYNKYGDIKFVYLISNDWSYWRLINDNSSNFGKDSFTELENIFAYSVLNKKGIVFHGVVMEWQGMGIIVCAHSGVGKSTHTNMWKDNEGALILNGDRALCSDAEGTWYTYGSPWCGSSGLYLNRKVKLNTIVIIERGNSNEVTRLTPFQGAMELMQLAFAPDWEEILLNCSMDAIDGLVRNIPVIKLRCTPDLESVTVLKAEIQRLNTCNINI